MHRLIGHAIVSEDDMIADAAGGFPAALRNEADWRLFQEALGAADLSLIGRASHEAAPNPGRRRLVVSRAAKGLERRADGWWLDPAAVPLGEALAAILPAGGVVAVPGGQGVFDLVGAAGFAEFHLARVPGVAIPGGRGLFAACEAGVPAAAVLEAGGLVASAPRLIDKAAGATLTVWSRPPAGQWETPR